MINSLELGKKVIKDKIPLIPKNPGVYKMLSSTGEIPFTLILGASFIAEVFVKTAKEDLLKVYEKKKGVNFSTL